MNYVVIIYLYLSLLIYLVLGGADFGAGIIELFTSDKNKDRTRKTLYQAIGPIWEANHMWLIIAIVILFVGFPGIYTEMSVYLHIPLVVMLMGVIARGTAFVFRHYDAVNDNMQIVYNKIFAYSSFITPLFLGILAASAIAGQIDHQATTFLSSFVFSWLSWFSVGVGLFVVALCGFLAAIYLIGEANSEYDRKRFVNKARMMNTAAVICGALVFIAAQVEDIPIVDWLVFNTVGLTAVIAATLSLLLLWILINRGKMFIIRPLAAFQVTMILFALSYAHFPYFIIEKNGNNFSLMDHIAPEKTIDALGWALILGSLFIIPALLYLFYRFEKTVVVEES